MLGRFMILTPRIFFGALGEDTYEYFIVCEVRIHNLGLVETCRVDYTTFLLDLEPTH